MGFLTRLLTLPGEWLAALLFGVAPDSGSDAHAGLFVALGVAFWLVVFVAIRWAWRVARRSGNAAALARPAAASLVDIRARWRRWSWRDAVGVAWRAQAAHLAIYAAVPLLWEAARFAFLAITLPLWVIGSGAGPQPTDGTLDHLREPVCWTFATVCPGMRSQFFGIERETPITRTGWAAKGLWALLAAAWIIPWWRRRGRAPKLRSAPSRPARPPGSPAG